jgi:hypothetical protein
MGSAPDMDWLFVFVPLCLGGNVLQRFYSTARTQKAFSVPSHFTHGKWRYAKKFKIKAWS